MNIITFSLTGWLLAAVLILPFATDDKPFDTDASMAGAAVFESDPEKKKYIDNLFDEIDELVERGSLDKALNLLEEAEALSDSLGYDDGRAKSAVRIGDIHITQGRYGQAIGLLSEAYAEFEEGEHGLRIGNMLATAYRFNDNLQESLNLYLSLIERLQEEKDPLLEAGIEQNIAVVYERLGDTNQAIERYFNSLEIAESKADTTLKIVVTNNIGDLYRKEGDLDFARKFITESLELSKEINSLENMSRAYTNLGIISRLNEDYEEALDYYQKSFDIANRIGNVVGPVQILFNIGNIYLDQEQYDLARDAFHESLDKSLELNINQGQYYNNLGLADVHRAFEEYDMAIDRLNRSLELARQAGSVEMEKPVLERLWEVHEKAGHYEEAFSNLKLYHTISDSLQAMDKVQALAQYETLYNLRNERRQNELLGEKLQAQRSAIIIGVISMALIIIAASLLLWMYRKQRVVTDRLRIQHSELEQLYKQVEKQKEELAHLNLTKDKLFSVLGHDLRTPVTQLQSLVMLFREDEMEELDLNEVIQQVENQLQHSISTLENYLNWAQSQMKGLQPELQPVQLREKAAGVIGLLSNMAKQKGIYIQNNIDENAGVIADQGMLFIILQNLISNALKYSHPSGEVTLEANTEGSKTILMVKDTGIGIPFDKQEVLFKAFDNSRKGTNNERGTGLGLSICREFVEKQNGRIWFESTPGDGSVFYVEFDAEEVSVQV